MKQLTFRDGKVILKVGMARSWWASRSSTPVSGRVASRGGFDSHPFPFAINQIFQAYHLLTVNNFANQIQSQSSEFSLSVQTHFQMHVDCLYNAHQSISNSVDYFQELRLEVGKIIRKNPKKRGVGLSHPGQSIHNPN